jgi:cell division protein FtsB
MLGKLVTCKLYRPFQLCSVEGREEQRLRVELADLKKERTDLERKITFLKTREGVAQAARKLGYVKPGEITLVMPEEGSTKDR